MVWVRLRVQNCAVNRKAVQRIMQIKGWQCQRRLKKRCSPRVQSSVSIVAAISNARGAADATYIWSRWDGLIHFNPIVDCADRANELPLMSAKAMTRSRGFWPLKTRSSIASVRYRRLTPEACCVPTMRSCTNQSATAKLAKSYGLHQEFIPPQYA